MRGKGLIIAFVMLLMFSGVHALPSLVDATFRPDTSPVFFANGYTYFDYPIYEINVTINNDMASHAVTHVLIEHGYTPYAGNPAFPLSYSPVLEADINVPPGEHVYRFSVPLPRPPLYVDTSYNDSEQTFRVTVGSSSITHVIRIGTDNNDFNYMGNYRYTAFRSGGDHYEFEISKSGAELPNVIDVIAYTINESNATESAHVYYYNITQDPRIAVYFDDSSSKFAVFMRFVSTSTYDYDFFPLYGIYQRHNWYQPYDSSNPNLPRGFMNNPLLSPSLDVDGDKLHVYLPIAQFPATLSITGNDGNMVYTIRDPLYMPLDYGFDLSAINGAKSAVLSDSNSTLLSVTFSTPITATADVYYTVEPTTCSPLYHYSVRISGEGTHSVEIKVRNDDLNINYLLHSSTEDLPVEINGDILYSLPPSSYPPYYLDVIVDGNTVLSKAFEVIAPASIMVNNVYVPNSYTYGDTIPVTVELKNTGDLECSESVTIEIKNGEGNIIATDTLSANVPANSEVNVTTTFTLNKIEPLHVYVNGTERAVIEYDPPEAEVEAEAGLYDPYDINSGIHYEVTVTGRGDYNVSVEIFDPVSNDSIPLYNGIVTANPTATIEDTVFPALEVNRSYYLRVFVDGSLKAAVPFVYDSAYAPATIVSAKLDRNYYEPGSTATLSLNVDYPGNKGYVSLYIDENYLKSVYFHGEKFKLVSFTVPEPLGGHVLKVEGNNTDVLIFYSVENPQSYGEGTVNYTEAVASFFNNPALLILVIVLGISIYLAIEFGFSILLTAGGLLFLFGIFGVIPLGYGIGGLVLALIDIMLRRRE